LHFLLALVVILALAWLASYDRQKIRIRYILQLIIIEIALAFFFLHAESGLWLVKNISGFLNHCSALPPKAPICLWRHE
jgi:CNT family concentrative nucleoside transporter